MKFQANFALEGIVRTACCLWLLDFDTVFEKDMIAHAIAPVDEEFSMWQSSQEVSTPVNNTIRRGPKTSVGFDRPGARTSAVPFLLQLRK